MIKEYKDISLKGRNTFGLDINAKRLIEFDVIDDIYPILHNIEKKILVLGGGSNVLFTGNFDGTIIIPATKGIDIIDENNETITIKAAAGIKWDEFVEYCVNHSYGGIENLSLIPGNVGACPIQNIGAYGSEVRDTISEVEFFNIKQKTLVRLNNKACGFGYRESIFKHQLNNNIIVLSVTFTLTRINHLIKLDYGNLEEEVKKVGEVNLRNIRKAVINIRRNKLPDPDETGNAGSFFRNPVVSETLYNSLKEPEPNIPAFKTAEGFFKIPAAWLIERAGWKGKQKGNVATHHIQPLVIINKTGRATGREIVDFAVDIVNDIDKKFGIKLVSEVNII